MTSRPVSFPDSLSQRGLPTARAAWYVGCQTIEQFEREVGNGIWPKHVAGSKPKRWDKSALDRAMDIKSGLIGKRGRLAVVDGGADDDAASASWEERARNFGNGSTGA